MTRIRVLTTLIVMLLAASACSQTARSPEPLHEAKETTTSMSTTTRVPVTTSSTTAQSTTTTSTTITPTTTTVATPSDCPDFDPTGQVLRKLASLKFFDPKVDTCDPAAIKDVLAAFQKSQRLEVNGLYTPELAQAILDAQPIAASIGSESNRIVVELDRQLMFLYRDGQLARVQHVSTGSDQLMPTPTGRFYITQMYPGRPPGEDSEHPMYFSNIEGVSIHGYPTVPYHEAASHGCVRIPLQIILWFYEQVDQMTDLAPLLVYVV